MSKPLQSGYHPDADQISAFVEHALAAHEREQMLDHLAVCRECRAIVALSLPEIEETEPAQPLHTGVRKPWWSGWTLAWSAAAAFASLTGLVIYVHHAAIGPVGSGTTQIAVSRPTESPIPQSQSPVPPSKAPQRSSPAQPASSGRAISAGNRSIASHQNGEAPISPRIVPLPMQARNLAPLDQKIQAPNAAFSNGVVSALGAAPSAGPETRPQNLAPSVHGGPFGFAAPPAPTATGKAPIGQSTETVTVTTPPPMEAVPSNSADAALTMDEAQVTQFVQLKKLLPSRLPVLSMATQARRVVAIDTNNAVFLSNDVGKHWQAIQPPWQGRPVRASLVQFPSENRESHSQMHSTAPGAMAADTAVSAGRANGALTQRDQPSAVTPCCSLTGTVTDRTGAEIPGASVSIIDTTSRAARTAKTDSAGRYFVDGLAPGTYKLDAQAPGFMKQEIAAVSVTNSRSSVADLSLDIGAAAQTVTVEAEPNEISLEKKTNAKPKSAGHAPAVFEIVTDNGDHWMSIDGVTWKHM